MTKLEIEYEQAPSGYVTFYNYKEPLMRFEKGYGFVGALVFDGETDKLQCHLCGEWHAYLPNHLLREHNVRADAYKEMVGLNKTTALISEKQRAALIANGLGKRMKNLKVHKRHTEESKEKIRQTLKENRAEQQNLRNTCPEQLLDRLKKLHQKLGRTPTDDEIPFHATLDRVYGNITNACRLAGIPPRKPGQTITKRLSKHRISEAVDWIREFISLHKKKPRARDWIANGRKGMYQHFKKKDLIPTLIKEATLQTYVRLPGVRYSDEELIAVLQLFEKTNGRKPSYSDARRGLIPHLSRYSSHFGSWKNALKLAFPQ